jgi:NADPH:quinone reductase-like Zn-dependent oxidoreductase
MKAIVYEKYGPPDVLQLKDVAKPVPKEDQVLVEVYAASINALDWHLLSADIFLVRLDGGFQKPKNPILGVDVAGRVEAVGAQVTQFGPGDEVFGFGVSTFAEYACAGENKIVLKPANLSFEQAAAVPIAALTALQALRDSGAIQAGQKVLIQGASGGVGTFAVQLAKSFGAEVTGVCSTRNLDMVHSLGADHVIDYKKEDFTRNGQRYDLILAVNGYHPIGDYRHSLNPKGIYVMAGGTPAQMFQAITLGPWFSKGGNQKMGMMGTKTNQKDLVFMKELLESGKVVPVLDACYPLEKTVEAFRYFQKVHARGKVVITMRQP